MHEGSRKAILAAFVANLGIAIAKFVGFFIDRLGHMRTEFPAGDEVEEHVRAAVPAVTLIYLEPDVLYPTRL